MAGLAQARSLSQLPRVLLTLHRYPAGAPLPGQGEVRHSPCLMGITFPGEQLSGTGTGHGRDSSDTYSEDGTVTRMAGTAVRHSQVPLAGTRAEQSEPGTASPTAPLSLFASLHAQKQEDKARPVGPKHQDCSAPQTSCSSQPLHGALSSLGTSCAHPGAHPVHIQCTALVACWDGSSGAVQGSLVSAPSLCSRHARAKLLHKPNTGVSSTAGREMKAEIPAAQIQSEKSKPNPQNQTHHWKCEK